jgi:hypothetical protein
MAKILLEEYAEFLEKIAPEVRGVLDATFQDAARVISPAGPVQPLMQVDE